MKRFASILFTTILSVGCSAPTEKGTAAGTQNDLSFCAACVQPGEPTPDIVLVLVDTLRADHLGTYGYHRDTSPIIDQIAAEGLSFQK